MTETVKCHSVIDPIGGSITLHLTPFSIYYILYYIGVISLSDLSRYARFCGLLVILND